MRTDDGTQPAYWMFCLAFVVGLFGGLGSIVLGWIIALTTNVFFYGRLSISYDQLAYLQPSPWGPGIILVPVAGAIIVTWITKVFSAEARGSGVPEVMNAIHYNEGRIPPRVVIAKAITAALSIGTGGSVGREGPIIQIGSAFASTLGQWITMPARQRVILVAAGASAGIAGTFNAPLGGLAFAIELMLVSISARAVALVAVATVTATFVGRFYTGVGATFDIAELSVFTSPLVDWEALLLSVPFGVICGLASALFLKTLSLTEDRMQQWISNDYLRHALAMLGVGLLLYAFMLSTERYYVGGIGYATVMDVLRGVLNSPGLLLLLFAGKLITTCLTLGSGSSGGVFSPSLFLGATLGAAFGHGAQLLIPGLNIDPVVFAIAGMAAVVSGTTGAVLTAITMLFEQTRDYAAILPLITCCALAYVVRERFMVESIYTLRLAKRGIWLPQGLQADTASSRRARTIMNRSFQVIAARELPEWQASHSPGESPRYTLIADKGELAGIVRDELRYLMRDRDLEELIERNVFLVAPTTSLAVVLRGMQRKEASRAIVMRRRGSRRVDDVIGVIGSREIFNAVQQGVALIDSD